MTGSPGSASADAHAPLRPDARVLVVGVNWLGDAVMSMPALQTFRRRHPRIRLSLMAKPSVAPLWRMHAAPDAVEVLAPGVGGVWRAARAARRAGYDRAYVLPNSFRSALVPYLAGIPDRIGMPGHRPAFLLTRRVAPADGPGRMHQQYEYADLLLDGGAPEAEDRRPRLDPPASALAEARRRAERAAALRVAVFPGAARGPAKRWPPDRFAGMAGQLAADGAAIWVFGAAAEAALCAEVAAAAGARGWNWAGTSSLEETVASLAFCALAVTNDSGGMHLAAAAGLPVVAVFGRTDPARTGPLGTGHRIVQARGGVARDVARDDAEARRRLEAVTTGEVLVHARALLAGRVASENP